MGAVMTYDCSIHSEIAFVFWWLVVNKRASVVTQLLLAYASTAILGYETHVHICLSRWY
jgi:hypothetical protein